MTYDSFLNKSFQITFNVPLPLMSNWKDYFLKQINKAFENEDSAKNEVNDVFYKIYRLFRINNLKQNQAPTPREIKMLINKLVALYKEFRDEIPLTLQALYALHEKDIVQSGSNILDGSFLDPSEKNIIQDKEWQMKLAALHFKQDIKSAEQILLEKPIELVLSNGEVSDLFKTTPVYILIVICEKVFTENINNWVENDPSRIALSALSLEKSIPEEDSRRWVNIWGILLEGIQHVEKWSGLGEKVGEGLKCLLKYLPTNQYEDVGKKILNLLAKTKELMPEEAQDETK